MLVNQHCNWVIIGDTDNSLTHRSPGFDPLNDQILLIVQSIHSVQWSSARLIL